MTREPNIGEQWVGALVFLDPQMRKGDAPGLGEEGEETCESSPGVSVCFSEQSTGSLETSN